MGLLPLLSPTCWRGALRAAAATRSRSCGRRHCGAAYMTPEKGKVEVGGAENCSFACFIYLFLSSFGVRDSKQLLPAVVNSVAIVFDRRS